MTKQEIALKIAARADVSTPRALDIVGLFTDILSEAFANGENVYLRGFGTFAIKEAKEKPGRDIHAGRQVVIPARRVVRFKMSDTLKNRMNNG